MRTSEAKRTMVLLRQALNAANGSGYQGTRKSIQQAMLKLEAESGRHSQNREEIQNQAQKWWNTVVSGVANNPITGDAATRSLTDLNQMIGQEQSVIDKIEAEVNAAPETLIKD